MVWLPKFCHLSCHWVAIALFLTSLCGPLRAQSPATPTPGLEALSAHYNRTTDTIKFKLVNNGQKAATAYYVAFGVMGKSQVMWGSGAGKDLLDLVLTSQCRYADANSPEGDDSWEGAIQPGDVFVHSENANLPKNQLTAFDPPVRVAVLGVIWSDGSVETPTVTGATHWVTSALNLRLEQRKEDAQESTKVVSILNAHPDDADIRHRIGEATKSLESLMDDYRSARQAQASDQKMHVDSSFLVSQVLTNLNNFVVSPTPKVFFETYKAVFECQSKRRIAMLGAPSVATAR